jgi:hypothetical protein
MVLNLVFRFGGIWRRGKTGRNEHGDHELRFHVHSFEGYIERELNCNERCKFLLRNVRVAGGASEKTRSYRSPVS